ncbi:uncharacterized protein BO80DRAFT_471636 [Aspergillus ibericus CBS 121593]|uniref:Uncharacterized protein n=1 Tax=Aspergillus ibericus CBS 121593 TaxID=1448316 RepID=A0A395H565_9EURO|nr:hypothetical protein BO80DRAFT_471636 [Aspergillus ibericus CBS 121593]RAL03017.1 hypothetical protein BO80DRAFT_471636 [Aspergillus ibericus CBS 121593]
MIQHRQRSCSLNHAHPCPSSKRRCSEASLRLKRVSQIILERLVQSGIDTARVAPQLLQPCLPTAPKIELWERLLYTPMRVSNRDLQEALPINPATATRLPQDQEPRMTLYIRSFQMTVGELESVVAHLHEAGLEYAKGTIWLNAMEGMRPNDLVYVRYVGRTTRGAFRRHHEDLVTRKSGFLSKFLTCLERDHPTIIDSASLYAFPDTQVITASGTCQYMETVEKVCISLLGLPSLLNRTLSNEQRKRFQALGTRTIARLSPLRFEVLQRRTQISAWAADIQQYARDHRVTVSLFRNRFHDFSDALKTMMVDQAMPSRLDGRYVLLLTVGARHHNSALMLKSSLNRLWAWEGEDTGTRNCFDELVSAGVFPFVDLCPWYKAEGPDLLAATGFLKRYTMLVRPLVILTMSAKSSATIASGFTHPFGYPSSCRFWTEVSRLNLVYCDGLWYIQIPCFHPGQGRFSIEPEVFARVLDMTLWVLLLTISTALDSAETSWNESREDWCKHIKQEVDSVLCDKQFYKTFDRLKEELHAERPKKAPKILDASNRSRIAIATRKDMDRFVYSGFAAGDIMSDRRRQQAYRLWNLNLPELHVHISRENAHDWFLWANAVRPGTSFFVDAIVTALSPSITGHNQSNCSVPEFPSSPVLSDGIQALVAGILLQRNGGLSSAEVREEVTAELSSNLDVWQWVHVARMAEAISPDRVLRFKPVYLSQLNATEVFIWKNRTFGIYWVDPHGEKHKFIMCPPQSSHETTRAGRRFIFFTENGIDLRDEAGSSFLSYAGALGPRNRVTFPVQRLSGSQKTAEQGYKLIDLWQMETGLNWERTISQMVIEAPETLGPPGADPLPRAFFYGEGRELIRPNWSDDRLQPYKEPPQPADETWLLLRCLQEHWPTGGTLFIGDPEKWPARVESNIWVHFRQ